eukprot:9472680-Pyramimonas_sp.AAC.1
MGRSCFRRERRLRRGRRRQPTWAGTAGGFAAPAWHQEQGAGAVQRGGRQPGRAGGQGWGPDHGGQVQGDPRVQEAARHGAAYGAAADPGPAGAPAGLAARGAAQARGRQVRAHAGGAAGADPVGGDAQQRPRGGGRPVQGAAGQPAHER